MSIADSFLHLQNVSEGCFQVVLNLPSQAAFRGTSLHRGECERLRGPRLKRRLWEGTVGGQVQCTDGPGLISEQSHT